MTVALYCKALKLRLRKIAPEDLARTVGGGHQRNGVWIEHGDMEINYSVLERVMDELEAEFAARTKREQNQFTDVAGEVREIHNESEDPLGHLYRSR